jgi:uncharacterized membrane protein
MKKATWITIVVLASLIALYHFGPPFLEEHRLAFPVFLTMHLLCGAVALGVGAWQLKDSIRARRPRVHRWMGRVYVVAVLLGGTGGLVLATRSMFGMVSHLGFGALAVLWLGTTTVGYLSIRSGNRAAHRRWMLRSYALTFAAVTLRLYLLLGGVLGLPFPETYQAVAWLCWVPNLLVAELVLIPRARFAPVEPAV